MEGNWIDYFNEKTKEDMILEVVVEFTDSYLCRIVDYQKPTFKLKYGGYISIPKGASNV